jgi:hypothetical protein
MILNTLIDSRSVAAWLEKRIDHAFAFRCDLNSSEWKRWKGFQSAYFDLLEAIDEVLFAMQKSHGAELPDVRLCWRNITPQSFYVESFYA